MVRTDDAALRPPAPEPPRRPPRARWRSRTTRTTGPSGRTSRGCGRSRSPSWSPRTRGRPSGRLRRGRRLLRDLRLPDHRLLLARGARPGAISLRGFYARRVRRILPAALLVIAGHDRGLCLLRPLGSGDGRCDRRGLGRALRRELATSPYVGTDYFAPSGAAVSPPALLVAGGRGAVLPRLAAAVPGSSPGRGARRALAGRRNDSAPRPGRVVASLAGLVRAAERDASPPARSSPPRPAPGSWAVGALLALLLRTAAVGARSARATAAPGRPGPLVPRRPRHRREQRRSRAHGAPCPSSAPALCSSPRRRSGRGTHPQPAGLRALPGPSAGVWS